MAELLTPSRLLAHRLSVGVDLSRGDIDALAQAAGRIHTFRRGETLAEQGRRGGIWLLSEGWALRQKILRDGRRQITSIMLPGDLTEKGPVLPVSFGHSIVVATDFAIAQEFERTKLMHLTETNPTIMRGFFVEELIQRAMLEERNAVLGRMYADERLAFLLYETYARLHAMGMVQHQSYDMPLSQGEVADLVGMSPVHVNRTLQSLRARGLVEWSGHQVRLPDPAEVARLAQVSPDFVSIVMEFGERAGRLRDERRASEGAPN